MGIAHQDGRWNSLHYPYPSYSIRHPLFPLTDVATTKPRFGKVDDAFGHHEDQSLDLALSTTTADHSVRRSLVETLPQISESKSRNVFLAVNRDDGWLKRVAGAVSVVRDPSNPMHFDPHDFFDWEFVPPSTSCERSWKDIVVQGTGSRVYFQPPYQPRQSIDTWETVDMFPTSKQSIYPSNCSPSTLFAQTTSSSLRGFAESAALARSGDDWIEVDGLGQEFKSLNFASWLHPDRRPWNGKSEALILSAGSFTGVKTDPTSLEAEHIRIIQELSEVQELQRLHSNNMLGKNAMRELAILKARESRLLRWLEDIRLKLESFEEDDAKRHSFFDVDIEFDRYIKSETSSTHNIPSYFFFESASTDTLRGHSMPVNDAKEQLEAYNRKWEDIKSSSPGSASPSTPPQIPWPIITSNFTRGSLILPVDNDHRRNNSLDEQENVKWRAFTFFSYAFGLQPMWYSSQDSSDEYSFTFPGEDSPNDKRRKLKGLRSQLKLEKLRWHEDKLKALFGSGVAKDEKAKAVCNAVMNLKWRVDKELEKVGI